MAFYPTFTLEYIENMSYEELVLRLQASQLSSVYEKIILYQGYFVERVANATDENGKFIYKDLTEIWDYEQELSNANGEQKQKANHLRELADRAKWANKVAKKKIEERKLHEWQTKQKH